MYFAPILFSLIFAFNGLSFLSGAKLQIESRSECDTKNPSYIGCYVDDGNRDLYDGPRNYGYNQQTCNEACQEYPYFALQNNGWCVCGAAYATEPQYVKKPDRECGNKGLGGGWRNSIYHTCGYEGPTTTTTTEAPTTPAAAEKAGDCEDKNELCQMEPSFLLDILCQIETVKEQCPKRCNSCPEPVETTEAPTTTTAMPKCERKYNGYYSYGDCGSQNGVKSFEECCELTKQRNSTSSRNIIRFSWNGNSCAFKCGGKQDNRGGSWWSSAEDISTCTCQ